MLHELLFALNGYHGHTFMLANDRFKVNEAIPYFHPAEIGILNQLLDVATDFSQIEKFIRQNSYTTLTSGEKRDGLYGMYIQALCTGLDAVVEPYRKTLIDLEKSILVAKSTQLAFIQHKVYPYQPVMRNLCGLIKQIEYKKAHGCFILDLIYRASCSGVANVREAMQKLLYEGHKVLYKQLLRWILQGSLYDPFDEFFVACDDDTRERESDVNNDDDKDAAANNFKTFKLRVDMIPCHISVYTAEKIFFIGESIQLFERDRDIDAKGAFLKENETEFYNQLAELAESLEFKVADFERFVDAVRETASRHLHSLVLVQADLRRELDTLRSFFLLGRGELFQTFIEEADANLQTPPTAITQYDVRQSFMSACRQLLNDDEKVVKKVKMSIVSNGPLPAKLSHSLAKTSSGVTGWQCLALQFHVPWPLHLIVSPKVLHKYNDVFRFLLTVKRTQLSLHNTWAEQKRERTNITAPDSWQLRSHMMFVVDNLQHYLMADVLESQYSQLMAQLDNSSNFEELRHAHDVFLSSVIAHTFITNKPVNQCLTELLNCCLDYCKLTHLDAQASGKRVGEIARNFSCQSSLLFKLLTSIKSRQTGSQLAQLLLRIDYNRYFSTHGHHINTHQFEK